MPETKTWNGGILNACTCGVDDWFGVDDAEHDSGVCEVFECRACGRSIHVELPDA